MSVSGQTRRFRDVRGMSGLPQTADISGPGRHFAFGPKADIAPLAFVSARGISHRLQDALHHVLADLAAHVLSHSGRETIVETRPNTGLGDFAVKVVHVGPPMGYARQCRALDHNLRQIGRFEHQFNDTTDARAGNAVRTGILRMRRRDIDREPSGVALRRRIVIDVAVAVAITGRQKL